MDTTKTPRVLAGVDGAKVAGAPQPECETRELHPAKCAVGNEIEPENSREGVPQTSMDEQVTVPVHSTTERALTFELLRRQSTEENSDDEKHTTS